jgi:hypothetical protein
MGYAPTSHNRTVYASPPIVCTLIFRIRKIFDYLSSVKNFFSFARAWKIRIFYVTLHLKLIHAKMIKSIENKGITATLTLKNEIADKVTSKQKK